MSPIITPKSPFDQFPYIDILNQIQYIKSLDLAREDLDSIRGLVKKLINAYPFIEMQYAAPTIYRARNMKTLSDKPANTSELWYPPKEKINQYGRLNDIQNPV